MSGQVYDVFLSRPTTLDSEFEQASESFYSFLASKNIKPRRLGKSDYSWQAPLKAVFQIIDECCGAIILGYPQFTLKHEAKRSSKVQNDWSHTFPTPWNHIEGTLAYRACVPVLVIAHMGVEGGVFDHGVTGESVLHIDLSMPTWFESAEFLQPFQQWFDEVEARITAARLSKE